MRLQQIELLDVANGNESAQESVREYRGIPIRHVPHRVVGNI